MKRILIIIAALAAVTLAACSHSANAQQQEQLQQQQDLSSLLADQPLPHFNYSQERQTLIDLQEVAASNTPTTSFFFNLGSPDPIFTCPSVGLGVPDSASLSNPQEIAPVSGKYGGGTQVIEQMEPYGIYVPGSSTGTLVLCVGPHGGLYAHRWEGYVDTVTGAATWDLKTHTEKLLGAPTFTFKQVKDPHAPRK